MYLGFVTELSMKLNNTKLTWNITNVRKLHFSTGLNRLLVLFWVKFDGAIQPKKCIICDYIDVELNTHEKQITLSSRLH